MSNEENNSTESLAYNSVTPTSILFIPIGISDKIKHEIILDF